jgi:hypothetical protein
MKVVGLSFFIRIKGDIMEKQTVSPARHTCVVCRYTMPAEHAICPRCGRNAHKQDYIKENLETIKAGIVPKLAVVLLLVCILILAYSVISGKSEFSRMILPGIVTLIVLGIFIIMSLMEIKIGDEYFIIRGEIGFYSDVINSEDRKTFDLRRDKQHVIYTLPPNVEEKDKIDFTISQVVFTGKYDYIITRIENRVKAFH